MPEERTELVEYAEHILGRHERLEYFLTSGRLPEEIHFGSGTFGLLSEARSAGFSRYGVAIYRPTQQEVREVRAWHEHCDEHGYPGLSEAPDEYPPRPARTDDGVWVGLTWALIRRELRGQGAPRQLDLLEAA
jgi:hypothetical protein